jgi:hypothetical protein
MSIKHSENTTLRGGTKYIHALARTLTIENIQWYAMFTMLRALEIYQWLSLYWYFPLLGAVWVWCGGPVAGAIHLITALIIMVSRPTIGRKNLSYIFVTRTTGLVILWGCIMYTLYWISFLIPWSHSLLRLLLLIFPQSLFGASLPFVVYALWILDGRLRYHSLLQSLKGTVHMIARAYPFLLGIHALAWGALMLLTKVFQLILSPEGSLYGAALLILPWYIGGISQWYVMVRYHD